MSRRSTTSRAEEEFAVAVAALDRGREHFDAGAAQRLREGRDLVADLLVHGGAAADSTLAVFALRLELRLDQREQVHGGGGQRQRYRQHRLQRDEADVDD